MFLYFIRGGSVAATSGFRSVWGVFSGPSGSTEEVVDSDVFEYQVTFRRRRRGRGR